MPGDRRRQAKSSDLSSQAAPTRFLENASMIIPPPNTPRGGGDGPVSPGESGRSGNPDMDRAGRRLDEETRHPGEATRREQLGELRGTAAENLDKLAEGMQAAASSLQHDDVGHLSDYVSDLARRMTSFSSTLRTRSGDEILHDLSRIARENPGLFVSGSVAIGFGLARFARSAQQKAAAPETDRRSYAGGGSAYSPQSGTHDYAATSVTAAGSTGSVNAGAVNPADASRAPKGGVH